MVKHPTFKLEDVNKLYNNINSARSALKRMLESGKVFKIRRNLYTCVNPESGGPVANRFQIASAINDSAYVSHHSAMEYYGISNQVMYEVYVSSETRFRDFDFDGYTYRYIQSHLSEGVIKPVFSGGIRLTDMERTLVDCMKDMDKIGGLEECMDNIRSIVSVNEDILLYYLSLYDNQFLYQKAGYLLWECRKRLGLTAKFFKTCRSKIGKSKRYLTRDVVRGVYIDDWRLIVPENL